MAHSFKIENGDVTLSSANGRPLMVTGTNKLRQDISEFFTVDVQPNGFGAGIEQLIGIVSVSGDMFVSLVYKQISDGFQVFKGLQHSDSRIPRTEEEKLLNIVYLAVEQDPTDPTKYYFKADFSTEKGQPIPFFNIISV